MRISLIFGFVVLLLVTGCGGSSPEASQDRHIDTAPSPPGPLPLTPKEGVWLGTMTSDITSKTVDVIGLGNGWGELLLLTETGQLIGFPTEENREITGDFTAIAATGTTWLNGERIAKVSVLGTVSAPFDIEAGYEGGGDQGTLSLILLPSSQKDTYVEQVAGVWSNRDEQQNIVATFLIQAQSSLVAQLTGSHANGCTYLGEIESWTSQYVYDIGSLTLAGCPLIQGLEVNGEYAGSGALVDVPGDGSDELKLVIGLSNDEFQYNLVLDREPT